MMFCRNSVIINGFVCSAMLCFAVRTEAQSLENSGWRPANISSPSSVVRLPSEQRIASRKIETAPIPAPDDVPGGNRPLPPDAGPYISLADLESLALSNNPALMQSAAKVQAARGKYVQDGLLPNPEIGYLANDVGDQNTAGKQGAFIGQKFITAGKLGMNRAVASHEVNQAEWACQVRRQRVLNDVHLAFNELLVARRAVALQDELLKIGRQGVKTAEDLFGAKEVSRGDILQARIESDNAEIQLQNAVNRRQGVERRIAALVGVPCLDVERIGGDFDDASLPDYVWSETLCRLTAESPELSQARAAVHRARCALSRQWAERYPDINAQVSAQYDNATQDSIAGVTVGIPLPVFNRNQGNILRAQGELTAAENECRRIELQLQQRLAEVFRRYENARQQVEKYKKSILPNAKESLDLTLSGYRRGEFPYVQLLTAQRTFFQTNLAYLDALLELRRSCVVIDGFLLTGGLENDPAMDE